ncbi:hypothetical protein J1614_006310 [Plenodomus biglobosus]|nr:hypothetical protein J1614_006310 [Plenodomus biglobosus]
MDWQLLDYAKEAEDTASGLHVFLSETPQYRKDITGNIAELFAISNALHVLHEALDLSQYGRYSGRILKDLGICLPSLGHTLDHVRGMFSKSQNKHPPGAFPGTPPYAIIWQDAVADLKAQGISLSVRLELFRTYLQGMYDALKGEEDEQELHHIRLRLSKLLKKQVPPMDSYFNRHSVHRSGRASTPRPQSPKVSRPKIYSHATFPQEFVQQPHHGVPQMPLPHRASIAPTWGGVGIGDIPLIPPPAPEIPQSPTHSSVSSQTYSNHSGDSEPVAHWAMKIFDGRHSSTPFQTLGDATICLGRDEPRVIEMLNSDGFEKVLELPFEATNVWVRLYWRADDNRARLLFLTMDPSGRRMRQCIPVTGLKVLRTESCLQLCRVNRKDGQLDLWARLRFTLYERMVLFYCTVVAMKRQDQNGIPGGLDDFFQPGEKMEFSGETIDARYLHAFRIFRDEDSGCVRFEVTARRGPLKTIPIWTAFVTQYIGHKGWMKRVGSSTIQFGELHPYVFCEGYRVPKGSSGRYQLTFTTPEDAHTFRERFHRIKIR